MGFKKNFLAQLAATLVVVPAYGVDCQSTAPGTLSFSNSCQKLSDVPDMACTANGYNTAKSKSDCNKCKTPVNAWKAKFADRANTYQSKDQGLFSSTSALTKADAVSLTSSNNEAFQKSSMADTSAKQGQGQRATNATEAQKEFQKCIDDVSNACGGSFLDPSTDKKTANTVMNACEQAKTDAGNFAAQKSKDSNSLGDMGKLMDVASKAMGAAAQLAQAMQGQQSQTAATDPNAGATGGATSPTPDSLNPETSGTGASGSGVQSPVVGFGTGGGNSSGTSNTGNGGGNSSGTGTSSASRDPASSSSPLGSGGSGGTTGVAGGGAGAAASGATNGSGASKPGEGFVAAAAADAAGSNYEVNGGGGRAIVGLKPSKGDMDAVTDGSVTPPALDPAKLDDLGAKPGADNAAADDSLAHDGESIFLRVRQKYSLLKGAGRI